MADTEEEEAEEKVNMVTLINEKIVGLKEKRSDVIKDLIDVTQHFITRGHQVCSNDNIPREILSDLNRAITICGRLQNDIRDKFASSSTPLPDNLSITSSDQAGDYPSFSDRVIISSLRSWIDDNNHNNTYDELDQQISKEEDYSQSQEDHIYDILEFPSHNDKQDCLCDQGSQTLIKQVFHPNIVDALPDTEEVNYFLYDHECTDETFVKAVPEYTEYDDASIINNQERFSGLYTLLNHRGNVRDEQRYEAVPGTVVPTNADQTIPKTTTGNTSLHDAHQTTPKAMRHHTDADETVLKTATGGTSSHDADQTTLKAIGQTGTDQTFVKTASGTPKDGDQTSPKIVGQLDAHQTFLKTATGGTSSKDAHQTTPKTIERTDPDQTDLKTAAGVTSSKGAHQTTPKTIERTDPDQTDLKTAAGTQEDADQTTTKIIVQPDAHQTFLRSASGGSSSQDQSQAIPKTTGQTDADQTVLKAATGGGTSLKDDHQKTLQETIPTVLVNIHSTISGKDDEASVKDIDEISPESNKERMGSSQYMYHAMRFRKIELDTVSNESNDCFVDAVEILTPSSGHETVEEDRAAAERASSVFGTPPSHRTFENISDTVSDQNTTALGAHNEKLQSGDKDLMSGTEAGSLSGTHRDFEHNNNTANEIIEFAKSEIRKTPVEHDEHDPSVPYSTTERKTPERHEEEEDTMRKQIVDENSIDALEIDRTRKETADKKNSSIDSNEERNELFQSRKDLEKDGGIVKPMASGSHSINSTEQESFKKYHTGDENSKDANLQSCLDSESRLGADSDRNRSESVDSKQSLLKHKVDASTNTELDFTLVFLHWVPKSLEAIYEIDENTNTLNSISTGIRRTSEKKNDEKIENSDRSEISTDHELSFKDEETEHSSPRRGPRTSYVNDEEDNLPLKHDARTSAIKDEKDNYPSGNDARTSPIQDRKDYYPPRNDAKSSFVKDGKDDYSPIHGARTSPIKDKEDRHSPRNDARTSPTKDEKDSYPPRRTSPIKDKEDRHRPINDARTSPIKDHKDSYPPRNDARTSPTKDETDSYPPRRTNPIKDKEDHHRPRNDARTSPKKDKKDNPPPKHDARTSPIKDKRDNYPPIHDGKTSPFKNKEDNSASKPDTRTSPVLNKEEYFPPRASPTKSEENHEPPMQDTKTSPLLDKNDDSPLKRDARTSPNQINDRNIPQNQGIGARPKTRSESTSKKQRYNSNPRSSNNNGSDKSSRRVSNATPPDLDQTFVKRPLESPKPRTPDIWCQLGVIALEENHSDSSSTTGYPAHVLFHGYKRRTQIPPDPIRIWFDEVYSSLTGMYDMNEGVFTAPYRGFYKFHLSIKAQYPPDLNKVEESTCTLRVVEEEGLDNTFHWADCTVKHDDWSIGATNKTIQANTKRFLKKGEVFKVQAFSSAGIWFSVANYINLFILQSSN